MTHTIALFGGTGRAGKRVLEQALAAGHSVRMLARSPESVAAAPDRLVVIGGDVLDAAAVDQTIAGADVVVTTLGHVKGSPANLQTDATRHMVASMKANGLSRIIALAGGGVPDPENDRPKFADKAIKFLLSRMAPAVLADANNYVEVLRDSGLDWTVVRGPRLTDTPPVGTYQVTSVGVNSSMQIAYGDVAAFILTQLDDRTYVHKLPYVTR